MRGPKVSIVLSALILSAGGVVAADKPVSVLKTPNGGIQPQLVSDSKGALHLIYFKGDAGSGDIFYVRREPGKERFSEPIRVNSQAGSAIATGTIRGAQLTLGKDNRVHVAWNGSSKATPKSPGDGSPMLYARLDEAGKAFEPQRNLMTQTYQLDGGGTVAADDEGNVYVAWHAQKFGDEPPKGEGTRQVWLARSTDDGKTFGKEVVASDKPTGACGCCGMRAFVDSKGALHMLYRGAQDGVNRDMFALTSKDKGKTFASALVQKWKINGCTMSTESITEGPKGVLAAWETEKQVYFATIAPGAADLSKPISAPGPAKERKHPAVVGNAKGETLLVWTEDTGWQKGGALMWQVFDASGKPTREKGRAEGGIPVWGLPTAAATPGGGFVIVH